jgi:hypothetical protein
VFFVKFHGVLLYVERSIANRGALSLIAARVADGQLAVGADDCGRGAVIGPDSANKQQTKGTYGNKGFHFFLLSRVLRISLARTSMASSVRTSDNLKQEIKKAKGKNNT